LKIEPVDTFFLANIRDLTAYPPVANETTLSLNEMGVEKIIPTLYIVYQQMVYQQMESQ